MTHRFPNALSTQVGTQAPLIGVLMRIVSARRMYARAELAAAVRKLKQTQREPYARATVQVLPDAELTASHYARATTELMVSTYYTPKPSTLETRILSHYCTPLKT